LRSRSISAELIDALVEPARELDAGLTPVHYARKHAERLRLVEGARSASPET
jgi:hypothetical protein